MLNAKSLQTAFEAIASRMRENKDYLIQLDQQNGDGDLGISMCGGYDAVCAWLAGETETDLGRLLLGCARAFNESAPSSLGTITSFGLMGMAKALKGKTEATTAEVADAMEKGLTNIMEKAGSKPGEKTILDSLCPAAAALAQNANSPDAYKLAAKAAAEGSEATKAMRSVHGRAAYYGDKSMGLLDGGSVVGRLIFEAIAA